MGTIVTAVPAADGTSGGAGGLLLFLPVVLVLVWMFWSQSRRMKQLRSFNESLVVGDAVVMSSGLFGTVRELDDASAQLEIAEGVVVRVDRRAIAMKQEQAAPATSDTAGADATETGE